MFHLSHVYLQNGLTGFVGLVYMNLCASLNCVTQQSYFLSKAAVYKQHGSPPSTVSIHSTILKD